MITLSRRAAHIVAAFMPIALSAPAALGNATDFVRIANWNVGNRPNNAADRANLATVFAHLGTQPSGPLDVLVLSETDGPSVTDTAGVLAGTHGGAWLSAVTAPDTGGDRTGFVYNTASVSLLGSQTVGLGSMTHPALRGHFRPIGTTGADDFYVFAVHLKSGDGSGEAATRYGEASVLRAAADALGEASVIYAGDFNWHGTRERGPGVPSAWTALTDAGGEAAAFDPVQIEGPWRDRPELNWLHTQNPGGAMDDRFDAQLFSGELFDGSGFEWVRDSNRTTYQVVGNNGSHAFDGPITSGAGAPSAVLAALAEFDHLPVVVDYRALPEPGGLVVFSLAAVIAMSRRRRATN